MNPELFQILLGTAALCTGACLGFLAAALISARRNAQAYRAGRTDMEKLIRDRSVVDFRDRQNLSH